MTPLQVAHYLLSSMDSLCPTYSARDHLSKKKELCLGWTERQTDWLERCIVYHSLGKKRDATKCLRQALFHLRQSHFSPLLSAPMKDCISLFQSKDVLPSLWDSVCDTSHTLLCGVEERLVRCVSGSSLPTSHPP